MSPRNYTSYSAFLLLPFLLLLIVGSVLARDVWVSTDGSDTNPGTIDSNFRHINFATSTTPYPNNIYIAFGTYTELVSFGPTAYSAPLAGQHLRKWSADTDRYIIDGEKIRAYCVAWNAGTWVILEGADVRNAINGGILFGTAYSVVTDCVSSNNGTATTSIDGGLLIMRFADYAIVDNFHSQTGDSTGISTYVTAGLRANYVKLNNISITKTTREGIYWLYDTDTFTNISVSYTGLSKAAIDLVGTDAVGNIFNRCYVAKSNSAPGFDTNNAAGYNTINSSIVANCGTGAVYAQGKGGWNVNNCVLWNNSYAIGSALTVPASYYFYISNCDISFNALSAIASGVGSNVLINSNLYGNGIGNIAYTDWGGNTSVDPLYAKLTAPGVDGTYWKLYNNSPLRPAGTDGVAWSALTDYGNIPFTAPWSIGIWENAGAFTPSPSATCTASPTPSPSPSPSASATPTPMSPTPSCTPSPSPTPSPITPTPSPSPSPSPISPTPSATPSPSPSVPTTPIPAPPISPPPTPAPSPTAPPIPTPTLTPWPTVTPTQTPFPPSPTPSPSPTSAYTPTPPPVQTPTPVYARYRDMETNRTFWLHDHLGNFWGGEEANSSWKYIIDPAACSPHTWYTGQFSSGTYAYFTPWQRRGIIVNPIPVLDFYFPPTPTPTSIPTPSPSPTARINCNTPLFLHRVLSGAALDQPRCAETDGVYYSPWSPENGMLYDNSNSGIEWGSSSSIEYADADFILHVTRNTAAVFCSETGDRLKMYYQEETEGDPIGLWINLPPSPDMDIHEAGNVVELFIAESGNSYWDNWYCETAGTNTIPTPQPTATASPSPSSSPTPIGFKTPTPEPTITPKPTPSTVPTRSPSPSPTASPTASPSPSPTSSASPSPSPTAEPTATPSPTPQSGNIWYRDGNKVYLQDPADYLQLLPLDALPTTTGAWSMSSEGDLFFTGTDAEPHKIWP